MNQEEMRELPQPTITDGSEEPSAFDQAKERRFCARIGFGFALFALIGAVLANMIYLLVANVSKGFADSVFFRNLLSPISLYLFALPILFLIVAGMKPSAPQKRRLSFGAWILFLLVGFGLMYIGNYIGMGVTGFLSSLFNPSYTNPINGLVGADSIFINFICLVVIAPIGEELIFRKLLIDRLNRYGGFAAVLLSGLMFGLMHGNFSQFFYASLLGFVLGYLYCRSGNVWLTVALHAVINFVGGILAALISNGVIKMNEDLSLLDGDPAHMAEFVSTYGSLLLFVMLFGIFVIASMICAIVLPIALRKRIAFDKGEIELPEGKRLSTVILNTGMLAMLLIYALEMILSIF